MIYKKVKVTTTVKIHGEHNSKDYVPNLYKGHALLYSIANQVSNEHNSSIVQLDEYSVDHCYCKIF